MIIFSDLCDYFNCYCSDYIDFLVNYLRLLLALSFFSSSIWTEFICEYCNVTILRRMWLLKLKCTAWVQRLWDWMLYSYNLFIYRDQFQCPRVLSYRLHLLDLWMLHCSYSLIGHGSIINSAWLAMFWVYWISLEWVRKDWSKRPVLLMHWVGDVMVTDIPLPTLSLLSLFDRLPKVVFNELWEYLNDRTKTVDLQLLSILSFRSMALLSNKFQHLHLLCQGCIVHLEEHGF